LSQEGATTVLNDVILSGAEEVAEGIRSSGGEALPMQADVTDQEAVARMIRDIVARFRRLDVLVNNAGIVRYHPIAELSETEWAQIMDVNLKGAFFCCRAAIPVMVNQHFGKIVNVSSVAAYGAVTPGSVPYAVSKAGLLGFTRTLANELGTHNINVNAVAPGTIDSDMMAPGAALLRMSIDEYRRREASRVCIGRLGQPEDVANVICFLVSEEASFVHGEVINVAGGPAGPR
jgi:3-oxoacyl-[acyl-carrier protein] reductase